MTTSPAHGSPAYDIAKLLADAEQEYANLHGINFISKKQITFYVKRGYDVEQVKKDILKLDYWEIRSVARSGIDPESWCVRMVAKGPIEPGKAEIAKLKTIEGFYCWC
jgi:hypothetical protein